MMYEQVIVVRSKTQLELLIERFNTKAQAEFYLDRSGGNFEQIQQEHELFYDALNALSKLLSTVERYKVIDRSFLPNYLFTQKDLIIGIGQDGLIANIAKYVKGQPIVGLNPNPNLYDGILLPFPSLTAQRFKEILNGECNNTSVTMAQANFSDGQELLAFNDFFVGPKSHSSAHYTINFNGQEEHQSSSGIIISTGAGSTGWMSSVMNMVNGIAHSHVALDAAPEDRKLLFAVREPFISKVSSADICSGTINSIQSLKVESEMVSNGLVFSDGIMSDFVDFNVGMSVEFSVASERATLVQN
jgi:NAD kinase